MLCAGRQPIEPRRANKALLRIIPTAHSAPPELSQSAVLAIRICAMKFDRIGENQSYERWRRYIPKHNPNNPICSRDMRVAPSPH